MSHIQERMKKLGVKQVDLILELRKRGITVQPPEMSSIIRGVYTYTFHLANKEGLREEIEGNLSDWLVTGRTLEINEGASIVQDMKEALEIVGVNV